MNTALQPYVKPEIVKLETGLMNKFGGSPYYNRKVRREIDGVSVEELVAQFGSPLFVFSEKTIRNAIHDLKDMLTFQYPRIAFGWSYKTNYLDAICAIFHQEGSLAEVVSGMEYDKARRLGVPGERIIFNGPHKTPEILQKAVQEGARIHIDHFDEIEDLEKVAAKFGKEVSVAIRINLDAGIYPQWNRFGFNLESGQAENAVRRIQMGGKLTLVGLHCHIGTFILDPLAYGVQVEKMAVFSSHIKVLFGIEIEYLDIGGGFPSVSRLKGTLLAPDVLVPPMEKYAEAISDGLHRGLKAGEMPLVYLETGRGLIDEAGFLISSVFAAKRLPDGRKSYILDAGVNLLYTSTWFKYNIETDRPVAGIGEPSLLNGPLCMNIDVVDEGVMLPPLKRGTRLILSPVGAYNVTQSMQFIEYRPAVVLISSNQEPHLIREREELDDMVRRERLPDYLANF